MAFGSPTERPEPWEPNATADPQAAKVGAIERIIALYAKQTPSGGWRFPARPLKLVAGMPMQIAHTEAAPGKVVVTLSGRVMMGPASEPIVTLVEELVRQGNRFLVFDLSGITAIDSTGIGRFISSFNKLAAAGGEMRMAGATGHIFEAFHVSLLDTVFSFYPSVEEALKT